MADFDPTQDQDLKINMDIDFPMSTVIRLLSNNPQLLTLLETNLRAQSLKTARKVGDLSGKWAQKPLPKGVNRSTNPQRIF